MAIGDLLGELKTAYLTNAQRAAMANKGVQSLTGGPIARASQQVPVAPVATGLAAGAALLAPEQQSADTGLNPSPQHLGDIFKNPAQLARPPQPPSLASGGQIGVIPTATSPTYPTASQTPSPPATAPATPSVAPPPATLDTNYRPTGIGAGSNAIAGRIGANGVPEFSNLPTDLASAGTRAPVAVTAQQPTSLAQLAPGGGSSPNPSASLASLGSAANLGDGVGSFSQANSGDAQLATSRFQKAADLRDGYKAQDRLQQAIAAQTRDRNFNVVRDSTQPLTRRELKFDQDRATTTQNLADAVKGSQTLVDAQRQGVADNQKQRQATRLEDAFVAATAPNATPEAKQAYQALNDPTGANAQARRLTDAKIIETQASADKSQAEAAKLRGEASGIGGPKLTEQQSKDAGFFLRANNANARLSTQGADLGGRFDGIVRSIPKLGNSVVGDAIVSPERQLAEQSGREFITAILRKDSGAVLGPEEIAEYERTYLPQPGNSPALLKQKEEARTRALEGIRQGIGPAQAISPALTNPDAVRASANQAPAAQAKPAQAPSEKRYSFDEAKALPSGTEFTDSNGVVRIKH